MLGARQVGGSYFRFMSCPVFDLVLGFSSEWVGLCIFYRLFKGVRGVSGVRRVGLGLAAI